jgi:hypothetical protein
MPMNHNPLAMRKSSCYSEPVTHC